MSESRSYRATGVVLRTYKLGEADRIAVLLTEEHGKVRAVAKGVRKAKSRSGSRLEPASHVRVQLYRGRSELQTVTQSEAVETFHALRGDLDRLTAASAMLEAVDLMALDGVANPDMYRMLVGGLRTVNGDHPPLTTAAFFWRLLATEGFAPLLDTCIGCGESEPLEYFDLDDGGARCASCRKGRPMSDEARQIIALMVNGRVRDALALPVGSASHEVSALAAAAIEHHLERKLKSLAILQP